MVRVKFAEATTISANRLLSGTSMSLSQIAEEVGYGSETALSRAYKRWVGTSPSEWRRGKRSEAVPDGPCR